MQIAYVNVFVTDLDRSIEFYRAILGFELEFRAGEHGYASFVAGPIRLGLAIAGTEQQSRIGRHTGVGLAVTDLEAEHARLASSGVAFSMPPTRQPWGGFMAILADPDGNMFYLDEVAAAHSDVPGDDHARP